LAEYTRRPGYDLIMQGEGGLPSLTGPSPGPPYRVGVPIADLVAGLYALIGTLAALHARTRTGRGQHVDVSLLDGQISLLTYPAGTTSATGQAPARMGNAHPSIVPYETYQARDGFVNVAAGNDTLFRAFATAAGRPELAADPRFAKNADRVRNREALNAMLIPLVRERKVDDWLALCDGGGVPCGRIASVPEALAHPQVRARGMIATVEQPIAGPVSLAATPVVLSETPAAIRTAAPQLGEHTRTALRDLLALGDGDLDELER